MAVSNARRVLFIMFSQMEAVKCKKIRSCVTSRNLDVRAGVVLDAEHRENSSPFVVLMCVLVATQTEPAPGNGADGIRTHDPLRARQVLSQLSYRPKMVIL